MSARRWLLLALSPLALAAAPPNKVPEDPAHNELRAVRDAMLRAFDRGDIDGLLKHVDPEVVVTWQNAETSHGHAGVRKFYERMMVGEDRTVRELTSKLEVDELARLYKDKQAAVSFGSMANHFKLKDGMEFDLLSRWTAVLVKKQGKWKIIAFHISANMFDNGVLWLMLRKAMTWTGVIVGILALVLGLVGGILWGRRRRPAPPAPPAPGAPA
jgi:ketosteroid isomerase-like protein